jgi:hypothetical protein
VAVACAVGVGVVVGGLPPSSCTSPPWRGSTPPSGGTHLGPQQVPQPILLGVCDALGECVCACTPQTPGLFVGHILHSLVVVAASLPVVARLKAATTPLDSTAMVSLESESKLSEAPAWVGLGAESDGP